MSFLVLIKYLGSDDDYFIGKCRVNFYFLPELGLVLVHELLLYLLNLLVVLFLTLTLLKLVVILFKRVVHLQYRNKRFNNYIYN